VPCIDDDAEGRRLRRHLLLALPVACGLAACGSPERAAPVVTRPPAPVPAPAPTPAAPPAPAAPTAPAAPPVTTAAVRRPPPLSPPQAARSWDEFRLQAARRLVQAHPDGSYTGPVPEPLLAIPVLEVELNADGSVRRVEVLRHSRQARDTTQLAIDAVQRAAPYGAMARLPRPWKWTEVFLFDEQRRFKPRTLDE
jgi:outer membrane biosynthesis protein TonB